MSEGGGVDENRLKPSDEEEDETRGRIQKHCTYSIVNESVTWFSWHFHRHCLCDSFEVEKPLSGALALSCSAGDEVDGDNRCELVKSRRNYVNFIS